MHLGHFLKVNFVLYVLELTEKRVFFSVSCMTYFQCLAEFDGQQFTTRDYNHGSSDNAMYIVKELGSIYF